MRAILNNPGSQVLTIVASIFSYPVALLIKSWFQHKNHMRTMPTISMKEHYIVNTLVNT